MTLFKKAAVFTDIHFGRSGNSQIANEDNIKFLEWFVTEAKNRECETCIFSGDYFDNRHSIHLATLNYGLEGLEMLNKAFEKTYFIYGNHDLLYRESRDISSLIVGRTFDNITIIDKPITIDQVTFLPWLIGDEYKTVKKMKGKYAFAHLEVPGFNMNSMVEMPDSPHAVKEEDFTGYDYVFTGHFHMRQKKKNIYYIGNVMPFNFSDDWDDERGAMFLEWDGEPEFEKWPEQPLFRTMKLSSMLENADEILVKNLTARVTIDIDITYEEAQLIKDTYIDEYGLRKIELIHQHNSQEQQEFTDEAIAFQSVDQIVIDGLKSVESIGMKPERLIEIYESL